MDAFRIIEITEGKQAANAFKKYFDSLNITAEIKEKITNFDLEHPLYHNGFHPAFALHMIQYNDQLEQIYL